MTPALRRLIAFAALNFALVNAAMLALGVPAGDTDLHPIAWFATLRQGGDSWRPMNEAYDFARTPEGRQRTLYEKWFFSPAVKHKGFQYPPTALLAVALSRVFGAANGLRVMEAITWLFIPATALFCALLYAAVARERASLAALLAVALVVTLAFYPAMRAYRNGQIQTWINGLFAASLLAYCKERRGLAGALAGAMCLIKPQYALLALWGVLRREWAFVRGVLAVCAVGLVVSVALFGVGAHVEYLGVLRFIAERGESFYPNQSVNGLLNRALRNGENLAWMDAMPEPHPLVRAGTWLTSALLLGWALWPRRHGARAQQQPAAAGDLAMIAVAATAASPIAWEHHYGLLLPVFALLVPALRGAPVFGRATTLLLATSFVLTSHTLRITDRLADTPWNVLQSYMLAGALVVLLLLDRVRARSAEAR